MASTVRNSAGAVPPLVAGHLEVFACPACGGALRIAPAGSQGNREPAGSQGNRDLAGGLICSVCETPYGCDDGIPRLYSPHEAERSRGDVTDIMRSFYEEHPFPDYEDLDSDWSLRERAQRGVFARLLDEQIPHGAKILEVGCGTGQLSNFLSMRWGRVVFGSDLSLPSLKLGREFSARHRLENVAFVQMNLFRPAFRPESFDVVICNGVLHHTAEPFRGLRSISQLAKPGGHVLVGLYNTYARIPTDLRRFIFRLSGDRLKFLDSRLRAGDVSDKRKHTWFMDQYRNPHESKHTIDEVLGWFDQIGLEFVHGVPTLLASEQMTEHERLFEASPKGTALDHLLVQLGMLAKGGREGGFFIMIGRRPTASIAS